MNKVLSLILMSLSGGLAAAPARADTFALSLPAAEKRALETSNLLKSYVSDEAAAQSGADAQFQNLLPKLSLQGSYQYFAYIPTIALGFGPAIAFGTNSVYSAGPQLTYTLWDSFSARKSYRAQTELEKAKGADRESAELQILYSLRASYVQVQLGLEELKLIHDSMELARAQDRDVRTRFRAGAAARLDLVTSGRSVLAYEIQFKARQAELGSSLRDFFTLLGDHEPRDLTQPGPPGVPGVSLALELESLEKLLDEESAGTISSPGDEQPQIQSQLAQADSLEFSAASQSAKLYPTLQLGASVSYNRPDIPQPPSYWQESVGATLSLPLFIGDPTTRMAAQSRSQAEAAKFRAYQTRDNIQRDFAKAQEMLASLREQRKLAEQDVSQSEEEARLYYTSYKAGKLNLIDVQNANNQSLQSKVSAARIDAQILNQVITLKSLSGKETH